MRTRLHMDKLLISSTLSTILSTCIDLPSEQLCSQTCVRTTGEMRLLISVSMTYSLAAKEETFWNTCGSRVGRKLLFFKFSRIRIHYRVSAVSPRWSWGNKRRETFKSDRSMIQRHDLSRCCSRKCISSCFLFSGLDFQSDETGTTKLIG